ncbi:hypothetical protein J437_LFUL008942 [Ladona fulva]|uniref:ATP-dependent DNA helicase n=1 Tax=Ladona fulva TaxID=123851 RepID=A0A8K0P705_LADFU|nr:hypothetical protein J437_LFUL008942 [Ladona fulva]
MVHIKSLKASDRTLQDLQGNSELMGGALVILSGDFQQTLPVIRKSTLADKINLLSDDEETRHFAEKLLAVGEGTHPIDCIKFTQSLFKIKQILLACLKSYFSSKKLVVDDTNLNIQDKIPGEERIYKSFNSMAVANESRIFEFDASARNAFTLFMIKNKITNYFVEKCRFTKNM